MPWTELEQTNNMGGQKTGRVAAEKLLKKPGVTHHEIEDYKKIYLDKIREVIPKGEQPEFVVGFNSGFDGVIQKSENYHKLPLVDIPTTGLGEISESNESALDFNFSDNDEFPIYGKLEDALEEPDKKKKKTEGGKSKKRRKSKKSKKARRSRKQKK